MPILCDFSRKKGLTSLGIMSMKSWENGAGKDDYEMTILTAPEVM